MLLSSRQNHFQFDSLVVNIEVQESTEEEEASKGWTDHLIGNFTSVWKQDTRIQKFEADGSQWDGEAALQGRGSGIGPTWICGTALSGAVASGLGKVRYLN